MNPRGKVQNRCRAGAGGTSAPVRHLLDTSAPAQHLSTYPAPARHLGNPVPRHLFSTSRYFGCWVPALTLLQGGKSGSWILGSYGSWWILWILLDPYGSWWILVWILVDPGGSYGSWWILMDPGGSWWILVDPIGSYYIY